jgi:hypothetical protein
MNANRCHLVGRLAMVALLALGVLDMHGLTSIAARHVPDVHVTDEIVLPAMNMHGTAGDHDAAHLAENCLLFLAAAASAVALLLFTRRMQSVGVLLRSQTRLQPEVSWPGRAPPPGWSHLDLAVILR